MDILGLVEIPNWILIISFLFTIYYVYMTWPYRIFKELGIPGPKAYPILGTSLDLFRKGMIETEMEYCQKYKRYFVTAMGRICMLNITDEEMIRQIYIKETNIFTNRLDLVESPEPLSLMLTSLKDDHWKGVRNLMTPTFSSGKIKKMIKQVNHCAKSLTNNLEEKVGKEIEVKEYAGAFTMDVIASTAFGLQIDSQKDLHNPFVEKAKKIFAAGPMSLIFLILFFAPFIIPLVRKLNLSFFPKDVKEFFLDVTKQAIEERKNTKEKTQIDFLQLMLNAQNEAPENKDEDEDVQTEKSTTGATNTSPKQGLTSNEILAQSLLFFIAGYETTATAMAFLAYNLATNQECQEKLYQEILENCGDQEDVDYDKLHQMPYLEMCVSESLRLYPPAFATNRVCKSDITIEGLPIKKGMTINVPIWYIHHNPEVWPEPMAFKPQRWTAEEKAKRSPYSYMPFGLGPRNCIAMRLALLEVKVSVIHLVHMFKLLPCEKTQIPLKLMGLGLLKAKNGIWLKLERRNKD